LTCPRNAAGKRNEDGLTDVKEENGCDEKDENVLEEVIPAGKRRK
jgi:hypothetical protein